MLVNTFTLIVDFRCFILGAQPNELLLLPDGKVAVSTVVFRGLWLCSCIHVAFLLTVDVLLI